MKKDTATPAGDRLADFLKQKQPVEDMAAVIKDKDLIGRLVDIAGREKSAVKYTCTKILRYLSGQEPKLVYPFYSDVAEWLNNENSFIKWDAVFILSNLAAVDEESRFDDVFESYFDLLKGPVMVSAANVAGCAHRFVSARPQLDTKISDRLLKVPQYVYLHKGQPSPECGFIVCGKVLESFDEYFGISARKADMLAFARSLTDCPRKSVAKQAEKFLKKHSRQIRQADRAF